MRPDAACSFLQSHDLRAITRSSSGVPARRGPRPSSLRTADLPCGREHRACRRRAFEICHPTHVFSTGPRRRGDWFPNPSDMNSRWFDACDTANSARPMPGARREGRRTKRRTRHRDVRAQDVAHAGCHRMAMADEGSPPWRSPDTRVSGMTLTTRLGVGATRAAGQTRRSFRRLPAKGDAFRESRGAFHHQQQGRGTKDRSSAAPGPVSRSRRPHAPRSRA